MGKRRRNSEACVASMEEEDDEHPEHVENNSVGFLELLPYRLTTDFARALEKESIKKPTPVQSAAILCVQEAQDVLVRAKTGSGKRLAYLISLLSELVPSYARKPSAMRSCVSAIIIVPTSELCQRVFESLRRLLRSFNPVLEQRAVALRSEVSSPVLIASGTGSPDIVVSTPACVLSCLKTGFLKTDADYYWIKFLVFDEIDELLLGGYEDDLKSIIAHCPNSCRRLFSTSNPRSDLRNLKNLVSWNPYVVTLLEEGGVKVEIIPYNVKQFYVYCHPRDKLLFLHALLYRRGFDRKVLIFTKSDDASNKIQLLVEDDFRYAVFGAASSDISPEKIIKDFDDGVFNILIATDFGVIRGMDFEDLYIVVNFDMPLTISGYARRIDRTGKSICESVSLVSPEDMVMFEAMRASNPTPSTLLPFWLTKTNIDARRGRIENNYRMAGALRKMILQGME